MSRNPLTPDTSVCRQYRHRLILITNNECHGLSFMSQFGGLWLDKVYRSFYLNGNIKD